MIELLFTICNVVAGGGGEGQYVWFLNRPVRVVVSYCVTHLETGKSAICRKATIKVL